MDIPESEAPPILKVGSNSDPKGVAAAISKSVTDSNHFPVVRSIGHGATGQATKAIAISRGLLAPRAIDLAVIIGFDTVQNAEGNDISAMVFKTFDRGG